MTYEDYLASPDSPKYSEWVRGQVIAWPEVDVDHQELFAFLVSLLCWWTDEKSAGHILTAPFQMRLRNADTGRAPDIAFLDKRGSDRLKRMYLDGAANLAIEIISPESEMRDRSEKYAEYESEGVREYWLIDPATERADFFVLSDDHRYERVRPDASNIYSSTVLDGLWLDIDWFWSRPLPRLRDIVKAWGLS